MKVSIWQQFSANHSSDFTLIGEFPDVEQAERAFQELDSLVKEIDAWNVEHDNGSWGPPTPFEEAAARRFDAESFYTTAWLEGYGASERAVVQVDNCVTMFTQFHSGDNEYNNLDAFKQIMVKLGGKVIEERYGIVSISCRAPDEEILKRIVEETQEYIRSTGDLENSREIQDSAKLVFPPPPWLAYWDSQYDPETESLLEAWHSMNLSRQAYNLWNQQHEDELADARNIKDKDQRYRRHRELDKIRDKFVATRTTKHPLFRRVLQIVRLIGLDVTYIFRTFSRVESEGLQLNLLNLHFNHVGVGLTAIRAWLQSLGCTEITYEFVESEVLIKRYHSK